MTRNDYDAPDPKAPISIYRFEQLRTETIGGVEDAPLFVLRRAAGPFTDHAKCYEELDGLRLTDFLDSFTTMPDRGELYHL